MIKIKPNVNCPCLSGKKYKKCCQFNDYRLKQIEETNYIDGQLISSDKINFCINHYKTIFTEHKFIDITDNINIDNYKSYHIKNYTNKTIMIAEKTNKNNELFIQKSNSDANDIILMYKGTYRVFNANNIINYDHDIINVIETSDKKEIC